MSTSEVVSDRKWKLISTKNGKDVSLGSKVVSFRGEEARLDFFRPPRTPFSSGRVHVTWNDGVGQEYYPEVFNLSIVLA